MNHEELLELVSIVYDDRLINIWKALPEEQQAKLSEDMDPATLEIIVAESGDITETSLLKTLLKLSVTEDTEAVRLAIEEQDIYDIAAF